MGQRLNQTVRRLVLLGSIGGLTATMVVCGGGTLRARSEPACPAGPNAAWDRRDSGDGSPSNTVPEMIVLPEAVASFDDEEDEDLTPGAPIEDPSGHALDAFYQALAEVEREAEPGMVARLACYGDSHTAADFMTGQLRRRFQARFGDAGHGFVAAGRPWPSYRHRDVRSGAGGRWDSRQIRHAVKRGDSDGLLGLAGVAVETEAARSTVWVSTSTRGPVGHSASRFELFYLAQPGGGRFVVLLDDEEVARASTRAPTAQAAYLEISAEDGPHHLRVETRGRGPVRLFGTVVERDGPGVVVDSLGINGARITKMLAWDADVMSDNLARRNTDLVVLAYGGNSAGDNWYDIEQYGQWAIDAMTRVRRALPDASCLWVGPPDMARPTLNSSGPEGTPPNLRRLIAAQRDAAALVGCAYYDSFRAMGGEDSNLRWNEHGLVSGDGIHFSAAGYRRLGDMLHAALMDGYERYLETHP